MAEVNEHCHFLLLLHFLRLVNVQLDWLAFLQILNPFNILLEVGIILSKLEVSQEIVKIIFNFDSELVAHSLEDFLLVVGNTVCHFCL